MNKALELEDRFRAVIPKNVAIDFAVIEKDKKYTLLSDVRAINRQFAMPLKTLNLSNDAISKIVVNLVESACAFKH